MGLLKIDFDPKHDRVMICGSEDMTLELKMFEDLGSIEGSTKFRWICNRKGIC